MPLHLEIVTPERRAFEGDVDEVIVPGSEGEMGILPHHAPLISLLGQGVLRLKRGGQEQEFAIFGGFLQVRPDRVVVLAETADLASEIDLERAERARREAERVLEGGFVEPADLASARAALQRALIRIRLAERGAANRPRGEHEALRPSGAAAARRAAGRVADGRRATVPLGVQARARRARDPPDRGRPPSRGFRQHQRGQERRPQADGRRHPHGRALPLHATCPRSRTSAS